MICFPKSTYKEILPLRSLGLIKTKKVICSACCSPAAGKIFFSVSSLFPCVTTGDCHPVTADGPLPVGHERQCWQFAFDNDDLFCYGFTF